MSGGTRYYIGFIEKAGTGTRRIRDEARVKFEANGTVTRPNPGAELWVGYHGSESSATEDSTRQHLQEALGLKHEDHFRKAYLSPALQAGLIEMTIPDKPRSRNQRYRLTPAGREFLRQSEEKQ